MKRDDLEYSKLLQLIKKNWAAAGLVDTTLHSFRLPFELYRTEIPQR